ncbi:MAG: HRDC domain-containing protein [Planctomycetes bacterium]|nr:HRDC domain-containing protein [Planctomycetota bacterium]
MVKKSSLKTPPRQLPAAEAFHQAVLRVVLSLLAAAKKAFPQPLRRRLLLSLLRGFAPGRWLEPARAGIPEFGVFSGLPIAWVEARVDALLAEGYLELAGDGEAALDFTAAGLRALEGRERLPVPAAMGAHPLSGISGKEKELDARLRRLRAALAKEEGRPAYGIFPNRLLEELLRQKPDNLGDLAALPGMGPARLRKFGRRILQAMKAHPA